MVSLTPKCEYLLSWDLASKVTPDPIGVFCVVQWCIVICQLFFFKRFCDPHISGVMFNVLFCEPSGEARRADQTKPSSSEEKQYSQQSVLISIISRPQLYTAFYIQPEFPILNQCEERRGECLPGNWEWNTEELSSVIYAASSPPTIYGHGFGCHDR